MNVVEDASGDASLSPVVEFRRYALQPGTEAAFATLFERVFIETLEADDMRVIGQFRDVERKDRFIWLRGYSDMAQRQRALTKFYVGGAAWTEHGPAANAMIADSDDVYLLRPAWPGSGFSADLPPHPPLGATASPDGIMIAIVEQLDAPADESFVAERRDAQTRALIAAGAEPLAAFVTESTPNNFPRHPIREGEHVFVRFARFADRAAYAAWRAANSPTQRTDILALAPTPRSRVR